MANGKEVELLEVGFFDRSCTRRGPRYRRVVYIATGLKVVQDVQVGDTVTLASNPATSDSPATDQSNRWSSLGCIRSRARSTRCSAMPSNGCA